MSYTYLSTESDGNGSGNRNGNRNGKSDESAVETISLSSRPESPLPPHTGHRPSAWIVAAIGAVTILVGLSLVAFSSTNGAVNEASAEQLEQIEQNLD